MQIIFMHGISNYHKVEQSSLKKKTGQFYKKFELPNVQECAVKYGGPLGSKKLNAVLDGNKCCQ